MLIRKFVIAGLVLATVGLTVTVAAVVIGQQPGTAAKKDGAVEKAVPTSGTTKSAGDEFSGATPPAADSGRLSGTDEGTPADPAGSGAGGGVEVPPAGAGAGGGVEAPPAGSGAGGEVEVPPAGAGAGGGVEAPPAGSGLAAGAAPGKAKGPSTSNTSTSRLGRRLGEPVMPGRRLGEPVMPGMPGMPSMMPGNSMSGGMMPGMIGGGGGMPAAVSEDEQLETWVNQALADYAQTEDQVARKQQRELIAKALDQIFDIRQERRMGELETLEQRVQKLRGTLETREKLKSDILKSRLDYMIREADGLGWGDGLPAPGRSAPSGFGPAGSSSSKRPGTTGFGGGSVPSRPSGVGPAGDIRLFGK